MQSKYSADQQKLNLSLNFHFDCICKQISCKQIIEYNIKVVQTHNKVINSIRFRIDFIYTYFVLLIYCKKTS